MSSARAPNDIDERVCIINGLPIQSINKRNSTATVNISFSTLIRQCDEALRFTIQLCDSLLQLRHKLSTVCETIREDICAIYI